MSKRKETEKICIEMIDDIKPDGINKKIYEDLFAKMSDEDFDRFMNKLKTDEIQLAIFSPNYDKVKLDFDRNLSIGEKYGYNFYQRVWIPPADGTRGYLTPIPQLIVDAPIRRQAQLLQKKRSVAKNNDVVDEITGQAAGDSQAAKISAPEVNVIAGMGLDRCLSELVKVRGGDEGAFTAYNTLLSRNGEVSLEEVDKFSTGVQVTKALDVYLKTAHINSTLLKAKDGS